MDYKILVICIRLLLNIGANAISYQTDTEKGSLVFVFDTTGSMHDDLEQLRNASKIITEKFEALPKIPIDNYVLVTFNDPWVENSVVTTDKNILFQKLNEIWPEEGGDCPEECYAGIEKGLEVADDKSYLFVFTDASSKKPEKIVKIKKLVQKKRIPIYFFVAGYCRADKQNLAYRNIADASNGLFFDVKRKEINSILSNFGDIINEKGCIAKTVKSPNGRKTNNTLDVDDSTKEFTLTFIGTLPLIKILDPMNRIYRNFKNLANLDNVKMLQVNNPVPGEWRIEVSAKSAYSGQIAIVSDLVFKYGFSLVPPRTIYNTAYHPLLKHKNYLSVSVSNDSLISKLESVDLIYDDKSLKITLKLNKIKTSTAEAIYSTELFTFPIKAFKIFVSIFVNSCEKCKNFNYFLI